MQLIALDPKDEGLVWEFLCLAAHETNLSVVQQAPFLAHYASNWGRAGDFGFKAQENGTVLGVIWARLFPANDKGFGWVSEAIPEISLAVREDFRGQGIGKALMNQLTAEARPRFPGLSLNVREENTPAIKLYESCGFSRVEGTDRINRTGTLSFNMHLDFE